MNQNDYDDVCLSSQMSLSLQNEQEYDLCSAYAQSELCPSLASSFLTVDVSHLDFGDGRRDSVCSGSPADFASSAASVQSPITPIGPSSIAGFHDNDAWPDTSAQHWQAPKTEPSWLDSDDSTCVMNSLMEKDPTMNLHAGYFHPSLSSRSIVDPPLSRAVFRNSVASLPTRISETTLAWPDQTMIMPTHTIEPRAAFAGTLPSSPIYKLEPGTPSSHHRNSSVIFDSSPFPGTSSSSVLPSQWDVDETLYSGVVPIGQDSIQPMVIPECDQRSLFEEALSSSPTKNYQIGPRRRHAKKDMSKFPVVIDANTYKCKMCSKRFKRAEHRKRHEETVFHADFTESQPEQKKVHPCWVVTGGKPCGREFGRSDNLSSHLKRTHGRRSANQRNAYVATLDEDSQYYDPDWRGPLTAEGLPIGHPRLISV